MEKSFRNPIKADNHELMANIKFLRDKKSSNSRFSSVNYVHLLIHALNKFATPIDIDTKSRQH